MLGLTDEEIAARFTASRGRNSEELATLRNTEDVRSAFQVPQMGQSVQDAAAPIGSTGPRSITSCYRNCSASQKTIQALNCGMSLQISVCFADPGSKSRDEELESSLWSKISALFNRVAASILEA